MVDKYCRTPIEEKLKKCKRIGGGIDQPAKLSRFAQWKMKNAIPELREALGLKCVQVKI